MHLFYTPDIPADAYSYTLNEEESKHCIRVLRLGIGDSIQLLDGKGGVFIAEIIDDIQKRCTVKILESKREEKKKWELHIAIAPTKNMDRVEWFTEKATEIGIDAITFLHCKNSERDVIKTDRIQKVAVAAIKQSMKSYLPGINEILPFKKLVDEVKKTGVRMYIAHCNPAFTSLKPHLKTVYVKGESAIVFIGPEGDFTKDEIIYALDNGFEEINLGSSRLRTETAALYACTTFNILNE